MMLPVLTLLILYITAAVQGNVEKVVFVAPEHTPLPADASIDNLCLASLNPQHASVRTRLQASFLDDGQPRGSPSWFLLEGLRPGQRYEVRVCWLATQPTSFWLYSHTLSSTFEDTDLLSSLSSYAYAQHDSLTASDKERLLSRRWHDDSATHGSSVMFLQVDAAADYFSLNQTLMDNVPPVLVDIILDPYLLNIFPQSLVPTAWYIITIAVMAWFLSAWIATYLGGISSGNKHDAASGVSSSNKKKQ